MKQALYQHIANLFHAYNKAPIAEWKISHEQNLKKLIKNHMPSGSGFDNGTTFDFQNSTIDKLIFHTSFHHMNIYCEYDGWTKHKITVKPSFLYGMTISITGTNRNEVKDVINFTFRDYLNKIIDT